MADGCCSWPVFFTVFVIFVLSLRTILKWFVNTTIYKSYYAYVQSYWGSITTMSDHIRASLLAEMIEKLKNEEGGDVLEIACSVGRNLKHLDLPLGCSYIALDYNPKVESYLRENLKKYPNQNIPLKKFVVGDASNMTSVEDDSVKVVLGTQLLCSLETDEKVKDVLKEIKRVLKPGGYFFFMEHILDEPGTVRRLLQQMSAIGGIFPLFMDGCQFNKETWKYIESAGFKDVVYKKTEQPDFCDWKYPVLTILRYLSQVKLHGYAIK